jgi:hypothetical protein
MTPNPCTKTRISLAGTDRHKLAFGSVERMTAQWCTKSINDVWRLENEDFQRHPLTIIPSGEKEERGSWIWRL